MSVCPGPVSNWHYKITGSYDGRFIGVVREGVKKSTDRTSVE